MEKTMPEKMKSSAPLKFGVTLSLMILNVHEIKQMLRQHKNPVSTEIMPDYKKTIEQVHFLAETLSGNLDTLIENLLLDGYKKVLDEALVETKK
jgi:hypothetical protein